MSTTLNEKSWMGGNWIAFGSSLDDGQWNGKTTQTANSSEKSHFLKPKQIFQLSSRLSMSIVEANWHFPWQSQKRRIYAAAVRCRSSAIWRRQRLSPWENIYERAKILWNFHIATFFFSSFSFTSNDIHITHITLVWSSMRSYVSLLSFHISTRRRNVITLYGRSHTLQMGRRAHRIKITAQIVLVWVDKCYGRERKNYCKASVYSHLFVLSKFQAPHMDRCFPFHSPLWRVSLLSLVYMHVLALLDCIAWLFY